MRTGDRQRKVRQRGKGKEMQKQNRKKGNHTVSCSKIRAIPLQSVSVCRPTHGKISKYKFKKKIFKCKKKVNMETWVKQQAEILLLSHACK